MRVCVLVPFVSLRPKCLMGTRDKDSFGFMVSEHSTHGCLIPFLHLNRTLCLGELVVEESCSNQS